MATRKPRSDAEEVRILYENLPEIVKPTALKFLRSLDRGNNSHFIAAIKKIKNRPDIDGQ